MENPNKSKSNEFNKGGCGCKEGSNSMHHKHEAGSKNESKHESSAAKSNESKSDDDKDGCRA